MHRVATVIALVFVALACLATPAFGDLAVNSWYLQSGVSSPLGQAFQWSDVVQNPYQETLMGAQGASLARTNHDFGWLADTAHFDLDMSHHTQQLLGATFTDGRMRVTPSVNSLVSAWGTWQFAWPNSAEGDTGISLVVSDAITYEDVFSVGGYGGNFDLGPPFGTLDASGNGLLLAGREYELIYSTLVNFYATMPPGTEGNASGEIHFSIEPVPEPAALALILPALFLPRRRKR